ncbi:hypothetical protein KPH14_004161 [Odynerus spinipes]|uniref:H15 domain-containing protein n=1 Tax=Odynerus spinipes TaxID=1348599 RepID=A0AAD9RY80_9HYME|nr:hypothetical protein KPH14_004161 [Odynerus spinipes]
MEEKSSSVDTAVAASTENIPTLVKKPAKSKAKAQRTKSTHPPTSEMVTAAIKELKDRKGSSLQAIKKYIVATYKVDGEKVAPFIRRYLKTAVTSGTVVQTKGKGASGSFKLSSSKAPENKTKTLRTGKGSKASSENKSVEKKATVIKKVAETKKAKPAKKTESSKKAPVQKKAAAKRSVAIAAEKKGVKKAVQPKTLWKSKKTAKAPAAKTKTPKPKKAAALKVIKAAAKK